MKNTNKVGILGAPSGPYIIRVSHGEKKSVVKKMGAGRVAIFGRHSKAALTYSIDSKRVITLFIRRSFAVHFSCNHLSAAFFASGNRQPLPGIQCIGYEMGLNGTEFYTVFGILSHRVTHVRFHVLIE